MSQHKQQKHQKNSKPNQLSNSAQLKAVDDAIIEKALDDPEILQRAFNKLPPEAEAEAIAVAAAKMTVHRGPIPDPETLLRYKQVQDDAADRIITMAEKEQAYRHGIENKRMDNEKAIQLRGQSLGIASVVLVLALSSWLYHLGLLIAGILVQQQQLQLELLLV